VCVGDGRFAHADRATPGHLPFSTFVDEIPSRAPEEKQREHKVASLSARGRHM